MICGKAECEVEFTKTRHNQKYCPEHRTKSTRERYRYLRSDEEQELGALEGRVCQLEGCIKTLKGKRAKTLRYKYCSDEHTKAARKKAKAQDQRIRQQRQRRDLAGRDIPTHVQHGETLRALQESGDAERIDAGTLTVRAAAEIHSTTPATVSRSMDAWRILQARASDKAKWRPSWLTRALLPTAKLLRIRELGLAGEEESDEFQSLADQLTRAYAVFSRYFFRLEGDRPLVKDFHLRWIRSIIVAYAIGGKQLILSPPRHGKSEVLIRFVVWLIAMFPNIRIVWVAANTDVAKMMLGAVKDHLLNNTELIEAVLPPGESFKPTPQQGRVWSQKEIKVRQQTHVGAKSSSMLALGATSKILNRDMDLIIVDDLEDFDSTLEPAQRKKTKQKFAEYGTRKEEKTAWVDITSRQHPDDVAGALLASAHTEQAWRIIVDSAHAECQLDPEIIDGHDENGCMLFPEVRSYRWLMEKKYEMETLGVEGAYEMRYLNNPTPTEGLVFHVDVIRDRALDRSRDLGIEELPSGILYGGLDPASKGTQAAFCWHFTPSAFSMVDLQTQEAGGIAGALSVMEEWHALYGLTDWYYEDNAGQVEFFRDPRFKELSARLGLVVRPHTTGKNKQDPEYGISSMAPLYHNGTINLPYGTTEARRKVNLLLDQLALWTTDGIIRGRRRKSDVKMASWFSFPRMLRRMKVERYQETMDRGSEQSYPTISHSTSVPWTTPYPKG